MADPEFINDLLFLRINAGGATPAWLLAVARVLADDTIYFIPVLLAAMWLCGDEARRNLTLRTFLIVSGALVINQFINFYWPHPRPFMIGLGHAWLQHAADSSFPSDHLTVFSAAGISLVAGGMRRTGAALLALGLGTAWARIFLGVHYPLDMAGAVLITALAALLLFPVWRRRGERVTRNAQALYRWLLAAPIRRQWLPR